MTMYPTEKGNVLFNE